MGRRDAFKIDETLPPDVAELLRHEGHEALSRAVDLASMALPAELPHATPLVCEFLLKNIKP
jgi:hypothetical protein